MAAGAAINVVTKSGTNQLHGSAFFLRNSEGLNANTFNNNANGLAKPDLSSNIYGGTLGGPILKDKLHFFVSYERNRDARTEVRSGFVPTAAERAGDFSGPSLAGCTPPVPTDPLTGQPFPGNVIPPDRIDPAGLAFLQLYQSPTRTPTSGCDNYVGAVAAPIRWDQINARVDWNVDERTRVMLRYIQDRWRADNSLLGFDSPLSVVGSNWEQPGRSLVAQLNRAIGSRMTNTLTFSYSGNAVTATRTGDAALVNEINELLPTVFAGSVKQTGGAAQPFFWGAGPYGPLFNFAPWENNQDLYVLKDDFSAVFGRHFLKAGLFLSTNAKNEQAAAASAESVGFSDAAGYLTPAGYVPGLTTGNPVADVMLRGTVFATQELRTAGSVKQRWRDLELYLADSTKLSPRVTVDLGVRLSHHQPPWMADDRQANFVPATADPSLGDSSCNGLTYPPGTNPCPALGLPGGTHAPSRSLVPARFLWVAPRLGVAWNVFGDGKTAVRGGLGLFFERERLNEVSAAGLNPPFSGTASVTRTLDSNSPVTGEAVSEYGAPGTALEVAAANVHSWQWNVAVERELVRDTRVEVAYVGSRGLDLLGQTNLNEVSPENRLAFARTGDVSLRPLAGIAGIGDGELPLWRHDRDSIYHALQIALDSRFGRGSRLSLAYTWSKLITSGASDASDGRFDANLVYTDSTEPSLNRGRGGTDRTHVFSASLVLVLPGMEGRGAVVRNLLGGWELAAIVQAASGYPLTVGAWVPGLAGLSGTSHYQLQTPNRVAGQPCTVRSGDRQQWLNPAAFTLDDFQIGTNGNSGRNICDGPGMFQVDAALYKNIPLGPRLKLQLRFEVFNVFDTVNFLGSSVDAGYGAENVVFDTGDPATATRILQATPQGRFGQISAARDPRTVQLGVRLTY
jgi:hypothetical protein